MNQRKATLPLTLHDDLIVEILLRLPVRSLLRFKCVCKSWLSLVSDPQFTQSHCDTAATAARLFLVKSANDSEVNFVDDSSKVVFNIALPSPVPECRIRVVGSCRGFILLTSEHFLKTNQVLDFVVWNPSTGLHKRINNVSKYTHLCGFGYDSSTDDYVIVSVRLPGPRSVGGCTEVQCFSLKTNSWNRIVDSVLYYPLEHSRWLPSMGALGRLFGSESDYYVPEIIALGHRRHGLLLNGALHWLVESYDCLSIIIAFDVRERRLSEIPLPHDLAIQLKSKIYYFMVMGGCLCLCAIEKGGLGTAIWTMKEYKVQSSWTKSIVLSTNYVPMPFTKNGELLEHRAYFVEIYCGVYRESLLSLPGEFEKATCMMP